MGLNFLGRRCNSSPYAVQDSNPNPSHFLILSEELKGEYLILHVKYPDCTNFEGQKLMVFRGIASSEELLMHTKNKLDPHFSNSKYSPIARFAPTESSLALIEKLING